MKCKIINVKELITFILINYPFMLYQYIPKQNSYKFKALIL